MIELICTISKKILRLNPYITHIINTPITAKIFPESLKHTIITQIHKLGDIKEPTNFRPINLLPIK